MPPTDRKTFARIVVFLVGLLVLGSGAVRFAAISHNRVKSTFDTPPPQMPLRPVAPGVVLSPSSIDFGDVRQNDDLVRTVRVVNQHEHPIVVTRVETSCGCTSALDAEGKRLESQEGYDVPVSVKTGSHDGLRTASLTLHYSAAGPARGSSAETNSVSCRIRANIIPDFRVEPESIDFGVHDQSDLVSKTIRLVPVRVRNIQIKSLISTNQAFIAERSGEDDSGAVLVKLTFDPKKLLSPGPTAGTLIVSTDSVNTPTGRAALQARYRAPVDIEPASVVIARDITGRVQKVVKLVTHYPSLVTPDTIENSIIRITSIDRIDELTHRVTLDVPDLGDKPISSRVSVRIKSADRTARDGAIVVTIPVFRIGKRSSGRGS